MQLFVHNFLLKGSRSISFFRMKLSKQLVQADDAMQNLPIFITFQEKTKHKILTTYPFYFVALFQGIPIFAQTLVS